MGEQGLECRANFRALLLAEAATAVRWMAVAVSLSCALFTVLASGAVLAAYVTGMAPATLRDILVLALKAASFFAVAGFSFYAVKHCRVSAPPASGGAGAPSRAGTLHWLFFIGPLCAAAALVFPRLDAYPWPAPDETYHLTMARNLAVHGLYASGRPETGFVPFDGYASVGPTVLVPIAAAFRLFGVSLIVARVVMALHFMALCVVVFGILRRRFSSAAACAGVLLTIGSFGSIYLARSLYGEVPALFYALLALLLWQHTVNRPGAYFCGILAGLAFALALLSKLFFAIAAVPMLAVLVMDRNHTRRVTWRSLVVPGTSFCLAWGAWMAIQALYADPDAGGATENVAQHVHYLLFGFTSFGVTARWLVEQPVTLLVSIASVVYLAAGALRRPTDPALAILALLVAFFVFWWLFFTTGRHPRYMFYACAIAGMASGPLFAAVGRFAGDRTGAFSTVRVAAALLIAVGVTPAMARTWEQIALVYGSTEASDDLAVSEYVRELAEGTRLATTYWPLSRTLDFLADRHVEALRELPHNMAEYDVIILDGYTQVEMLENLSPDVRIGRYAVLWPRKGPD